MKHNKEHSKAAKENKGEKQKQQIRAARVGAGLKFEDQWTDAAFNI